MPDDLFGHLFTTVRWQVEGKNREEGDAHAGNNEIDGIKECLPPHGDVERYV